MEPQLCYYVCQHGASNIDPCGLCFPGAPPIPDDWLDHPSEGHGITDEASVG